MAFGPTCSPAAAQAVKNFNAEKFRDDHPEAVVSIIKHTYVDDYFNSHENVAEAVRVTKDAIKIFDHISNKLVGVQSNSKEFLAEMPPENVNQRPVSLDPDENQSDIAKVLGMYWGPESDMFTFKLFTNHLIPKMPEKDFRPTKRMVLSVLMKVFDPLGLISHYLIRGKILLQEIWRDGTQWDHPIEDRMMGAWLQFVQELQNIEKLKIPRQYAPVNAANCDIKLIVFTDASELAIAATTYFRFEEKEKIHVAHVMSKTKVAPLKQLSIPKLELQAAVLGLRLTLTIKRLHSFKISATLFATDSRTVLSWIVSENLKLKQFVAPRVGEILDDSTRAVVPREKQVERRG